MLFPLEYAAARARFLDTAARAAWRTHALPMTGSGPGGEALTIDVAISPGAANLDAVVVSSGLHGVEGPLGSAVQVGLMEQWTSTAGAGRVRCVLLHALNPYGFAWSRRVDADNVDLNRNFVEGDGRYSGCVPAYRTLDPLLNPATLPSRWDFFALRALGAMARHGRASLRAAIVTGQHEYPKGLFYGGAGPSLVRAVLESHLPQWLGGARRVIHLDMHTGLGAWGVRRLLVDYDIRPEQSARLLRWYGPESFPDAAPGRTAYRARGSFGPWCVRRGFAPDYTFAFVEFGTYGELAVLAGLRAENRAHQAAGRNHQAARAAAARLRDLFCPPSPEWRARSLAAGVATIDQAVNGLLEEMPAGPAA
jgi:hypothetical protein